MGVQNDAVAAAYASKTPQDQLRVMNVDRVRPQGIRLFVELPRKPQCDQWILPQGAVRRCGVKLYAVEYRSRW